MAHQATDQQQGNVLGRRTFIMGAAALAGAAAAPFTIGAQEGRDYGPEASPVHYPDVDVVSITPDFDKYKVGNAAGKQ